MTIQGNGELMEAALGGIKTTLDGGFLYIFSGAVPASVDTALDMVSTHTQLAMISVDDDGVTGLTFETAADNVLVKTASEDWIGLIAFSGAEDAETTLTPTFYRFATSGDDPTAAGSGDARLQGTVGGPSSGADMVRSSDTMTANGSNTIGVSVFVVNMQTFVAA